MPFDGKAEDYINALSKETMLSPVRGPARVYDKDNPPPTFAEALRMAAKDMEAMFAQGIGYDWDEATLSIAIGVGACGPCTAGAVVLRLAGPEAGWRDMGEDWERTLNALSDATKPCEVEGANNLLVASYSWYQGFPKNTPDHFPIRNAAKDPDGAIDDMFACADMLDAVAAREGFGGGKV